MTYDSEGIRVPDDALCYVTATDEFLSGWGYSKGKKNRLIFPCYDELEAQIVYDNLEARDDMKRINISSRKPDYSLNRYFVQVKTEEDYPNFYREGYFN